MHYALRAQYPIETVDQLKKTAEYMDKFLQRFSPKEKIAIAVNMEKRASDLGTYLDRDWIRNYSRPINNPTVVSPEFSKNMEMRKHACAGKKITINGSEISAIDLLNKIENEMSKHGAQIVIDELVDFDKIAHLEYQYDKTILDPVMTVYGSVVNSEFDAVKIAGVYTDYDIKKLALDIHDFQYVAKKLGDKQARKLFKNPVGFSQEVGTRGAESLSAILDERKNNQNKK